MKPQTKSPIKTHLKELKMRLLFAAVCFVVMFCVAFNFAESIYYMLAMPLYKIQPDIKMIYTSMGEGFATQMRVALYAAIVGSFPIWLFHIYRFIAPGLLTRERKIVLPCFWLAPILFACGIMFLYLVVMPVLWQFFASFQVQNDTQNIMLYASVAEYLNLVLSLGITFGLSFQMPVVILILVMFGLIDIISLQKKRKFAIVIAFILAAILTPPDVFSQISLAIPLIVLYELSIVFCKVFKVSNNHHRKLKCTI